jgi:Copper type II ascorbate-dependent monooxygenase, N-terminal domain/DOMON domain/Copper type II ascorbate-dependent monooxygenase, C-terminal domain
MLLTIPNKVYKTYLTMMSNATFYMYFVSLLLSLVVADDTNIANETMALNPDQYFNGVDHEAYLSWYQSVENVYTGTAFISDKSSNTTSSSSDQSYDGVAVHWRVDELFLYIGVAARAQDGWIGFGLAEAGGMKGADVVIYESSKPDTLIDAHILKERLPISDICQDWSLLNTVNEDGFLIFEGKRLLITEDAQDYHIINDTETFVPAQRIIAAWGDTAVMEYHAPNKRVRGAIRWYGVGDETSKFQNQIRAEADGYFDLFVNNYTIEDVSTRYETFCFNWDTDIAPQPGVTNNTNIYAMSVDAQIDEIARPYIHHAVLWASRQSKLNESRSCMSSDTGSYDFLIYEWAPGAFPLILPPDVGITFGPNNNAVQSFRLDIHYNNPSLQSGITDSGGLRIYYKRTPPVQEAGIAVIGDPYTKLKGIPLYPGTSRFDFDCSEQCSSLVLDEPVTVITEFFHMHARGSAAAQYHIRNGEVIRQANVNFFDFDQAGMSKKGNKTCVSTAG